MRPPFCAEWKATISDDPGSRTARRLQLRRHLGDTAKGLTGWRRRGQCKEAGPSARQATKLAPCCPPFTWSCLAGFRTAHGDTLDGDQEPARQLHDRRGPGRRSIREELRVEIVQGREGRRVGAEDRRLHHVREAAVCRLKDGRKIQKRLARLLLERGAG